MWTFLKPWDTLYVCRPGNLTSRDGKGDFASGNRILQLWWQGQVSLQKTMKLLHHCWLSGIFWVVVLLNNVTFLKQIRKYIITWVVSFCIIHGLVLHCEQKYARNQFILRHSGQDLLEIFTKHKGKTCPPNKLQKLEDGLTEHADVAQRTQAIEQSETWIIFTSLSPWWPPCQIADHHLNDGQHLQTFLMTSPVSIELVSESQSFKHECDSL